VESSRRPSCASCARRSRPSACTSCTAPRRRRPGSRSSPRPKWTPVLEASERESPASRFACSTSEAPPSPAGQVGEIVAEGENVAGGYFEDPLETASTFRDGRLHTGDLASVDADGYLTVLGRAKSFLKCGGTRTSAERFEEALLAFPDIVEAAVIGVPDEVMEKRPPRSWCRATRAIPRWRRACWISPARSFRWCCGPKIVEVLAELPKSAAGKVQRIRLHERLRARQDAA